jgi:hypothetical protein
VRPADQSNRLPCGCNPNPSPLPITPCCSPLKGLADMGYEIVSTGGSATAIEKAGVAVKRVEELTGFPEMLNGGCPTNPAPSTCMRHRSMLHLLPATAYGCWARN